MKAKYVLIVRYFVVLLFVYAAISKLITFEEFKVQLTQSPLLSMYAGVIAYLVVISELVIAFLLTLRSTRLLGLYLSYSLMVAFTIYIYLILNYSDFIPCSCGGVLEKLGWNEHLWFNIIISVLILLALFFQEDKPKRFYLLSIVTTIVSILTVIFLFVSSEHIIKKENPFIRKFIPHPMDYVAEYNLELNSYYLMGVYNDSIYIGNKTAAIYQARLSLELDRLKEHYIVLDDNNQVYYRSRQYLLPPYFYLSDGVIPYIYRSKLNEEYSKRLDSKYYFSLFQPIDSTKFIVRTRSRNYNMDALGLIDTDLNTIDLKYDLLTTQGEEVFDTDGMLLYNKELNRIIYVYFYKNEYLVIKPNLELDYLGNTIDSINKVQIEIKENDLNNSKKMITPPKTTNLLTATYGDYLFVNSSLKGKNESEINWKDTSVIDVYSLIDRHYQYSFVIPNRDGKKPIEMIFNDQYIIVLFDTHIRKYKFNKRWFKFNTN